MNRALHSMAAFDEAAELAAANGMTLSNPSDGCYQLRHLTRHWIVNLYPRMDGFTPRVYHDPHHRGPLLQLREQWTLLEAIEAAIAADSRSRAGKDATP